MDKSTKDKLHKKIHLAGTIIKFALLLIILIGLPLYIYFYHPEILQQFSTIEDVNALLKEYRGYGALVLIIAQIVQIVICFIPGQWIQFASGYIFGFFPGLLMSWAGALVGSVIAYYLAKVLGQDLLHLLFGEDKLNSFVNTLNSKKAIVLVFIFYLIPGVPKDIVAYAAGISNMKLKAFIIVSMIGRTPAMAGSLLIGKQVEIGAYTGAVIVGIFAVILCILGIAFRNRLTDLLDKAYERLYH